MLSRRNLRVKVFQAIYAFEQEAYKDRNDVNKNLVSEIQQSYNLYIYNLWLLVNFADQALMEAEIKKAKYLPTEDDLKFNIKISKNPIVLALKEHELLNRALKSAKLLQLENEEFIKVLFRKFAVKDVYTKYCESEGDLNGEKKILSYFYNKLLLKNETYLAHIEEHFPFGVQDLKKVNFEVNQLIEDYQPHVSPKIQSAPAEEEIEFSKKLLELTLNGDEDIKKLIIPKLDNWDVDRIAMIDMILMKMAVCELLHFENIPVKVSINEYIDISKTFSTPKSKEFINGILDNLMKELKDAGKIKKIGRGLIE